MKNLTIEQLRSYISESLIIDRLVIEGLKHLKLTDVQKEQTDFVNKYDEKTIRAFVGFKFGLNTILSKQRNHKNTDKELFKGFCEAFNDDKKHFMFDETMNIFIIHEKTVSLLDNQFGYVLCKNCNHRLCDCICKNVICKTCDKSMIKCCGYGGKWYCGDCTGWDNIPRCTTMHTTEGEGL